IRYKGMRGPFAALLALGLAACVSTPPDAPVERSAGTMVRVDLSYARVQGESEVRFDGLAHFVRYRSIDASAVPKLLGFFEADGLAVDTCRVVKRAAEIDGALAQEPQNTPEVSLLEAGRVDVRGPADQTTLLPHPYPELVPFVSGF